MLSRSLHAEALDALAMAVLVWRPRARNVELANRVAMEHGLVHDGCLVAAVFETASEYREQWPDYKRYGIQPPALLFQHAMRQWYLRTQYMDGDFELITCKLELLRESELMSGLQKRYRLTDRQADVLRYLIRGCTTRGTAEALQLSEITVRHHRRAALEALGVPSAPAAVLLAEALRKGSP